MGRKGYNWRARQVVETVVDNTATKNIKLDLSVEGNFDESNQLVLPSEKRKTKKKNDNTKITRILSKSQRKKLEKIVERKQKKANRQNLYESLAQVQATPEELSALTSIASVQTKGLKRFNLEEKYGTKPKNKQQEDTVEDEFVPNSLAGAKRKRLSLLKETPKTNDPNVVGFSDSGSSNEESSEDEKEEIKKPKVEEAPENVDKEKVSSKVKKEEIVDNALDKSKNKEVIKAKPELEKKPIERKPAVFVEVHRSSEIQKARLKLPILAEEQQIMEVINENSIIIIAGETGSGKTTQVPQFLYEAGYAKNKIVGITEPRRVAAISMSHRVGEEMNLTSEEVSYLIRFEGNVTEETKIKFMTDGVLLKEIQSDFLLTKYSVIILDEAHERSVYTDILIGLLSRVVPLRQKKNDPLKLIVMSATLRLTDFTENKRLFKTVPPVITVDARQFPVTVHFNKRTNDDYMKEALSKAVKVHKTLPEGGILIFVTGQQEVNSLVRKLRKIFPFRSKAKAAVVGKDVEEEQEVKKQTDGDEKSSDSSDDSETEQSMKRTLRLKKKKLKKLPTINLDDYSVPGTHEEEPETDDDGLGSSGSETDEDADVTEVVKGKPLWVLPLYSLLPSHKQAKVFQAPPEGCRLCIVSTNVAETSLTIPNVKYVIDSGRTKMKLYDKITGVTSYQVCWTSKASANQRAGRAGRVAPGHCYRLYSSAVYNDTFADFTEPEIRRKPVDDLYLQMKCMNIDKVMNFPFPTAPDLMQLKTADKRLEILGALAEGKVTALGKAISRFPLLPRFGKMLALSHQQDLLPYTICMVAALSVQEVLLETPILAAGEDETKKIRQRWAATRRQWAGIGNSLLLGDPMVLLKAVGAAEYANSTGKLEQFCTDNGLRHKAVVEIRKLRIQLTNEITMNVPDANLLNVDPKLRPPEDVEAKLLRQIILAGMGDQVARKVLPDEVPGGEDRAAFKYAYKAMDMEDSVFLHSGSVLRKTLPDFVVYQELYETNKMYMRGVTAIEPEWLIKYVPSMCNLSAPLSDPEPYFNESDGKVYCTVTATFGRQGWTVPRTQIVYPKTMDSYKWFGRFLLEGRVFPKLKKYSKSLLSNPNTLNKTWAKLQPKINAYLNALIAKNVSDRDGLRKVWQENPQYLLVEYQGWIPESARSDVVLLWPPLDD